MGFFGRSTNSRLLRTAAILAAVLLIANLSGLLAQSVTQSVQGLVTDSSGAAVEGARVMIRNVDTGVERTQLSNQAGLYSFQLMEVGNYQVKCERPGFRSAVVNGLRVETAAQVRQDFALEVGAVTETVNVSAAAVTLNTENAIVGSVVENKRIVELPLNGRNIVQLAVLTPGVQFGNRSGMNNGEADTSPMAPSRSARTACANSIRWSASTAPTRLTRAAPLRPSFPRSRLSRSSRSKQAVSPRSMVSAAAPWST